MTGERADQRVAGLTASRARLVAASDEMRRRLQQELHDGAQQELVHVVIGLKLALTASEPGSPVAELVAEALGHAERASSQLRELVHRVLPGPLLHGGLRAGLASLAGELPVPVGLRVTVPRLPAATELVAYDVAAEALANAVRHAQARSVRVEARVEADVEAGDVLVVEVSDDGAGGADPARGSGLTGLSDRVDAAQGRLTITSPAGGGTVVRAELPVDIAATAGSR